jgi:hypothetical protein
VTLYSDALVDDGIEIDVEVVEDRFHSVSVSEVESEIRISVFEPESRQKYQR